MLNDPTTPQAPPRPTIKCGCKQQQDTAFRENFKDKIQIYNQLDKKVLVKMLTSMEDNYHKLNDQRNADLNKFADRISELQEEIISLKEKLEKKANG